MLVFSYIHNFFSMENEMLQYKIALNSIIPYLAGFSWDVLNKFWYQGYSPCGGVALLAD